MSCSCRDKEVSVSHSCRVFQNQPSREMEIPCTACIFVQYKDATCKAHEAGMEGQDAAAEQGQDPSDPLPAWPVRSVLGG